MRIAKGFPISYTPAPAGHVAAFQGGAGSQRWTEPVVGFAVVVGQWVGWEDDPGDGRDADTVEAERDLVETMIVPVVLDSGWPVTAQDYAATRSEAKFVGIEEARAIGGWGN